MSIEASSSFPSAEELWTSLFKNLCERVGPCFARSETREGVQAYLRGLLSPVERKNGWQLAEEAGLSTPYAMQYLLNRAVWESDEVRDRLQVYVREMMAGTDGMLVMDETGFLKKGKKSVGVQRQYSGTAGRIENCQIGVFLTYASQGDHTLVDRELYVPKSWTQNPERCRAANMPEEVVFATKPELAARMLWRTLDAGLTALWVTGDSVYGSYRPLREGLEQRSQAYALAVTCQEQVEVQGERKRVDRIAEGLEPDQWQRLSVGDGSKGPRDFDWARIGLPNLSKKGGRNGWWFDGAWLREKNPLSGPMCSSLHPVERRLPQWRWPSERVGAWSSVLKRAKERLAWITMRSDPGRVVPSHHPVYARSRLSGGLANTESDADGSSGSR